MLNDSVADWIHLDIMDGHFVPNLTFGFPIIGQIKKIAKKPLDVHLMITNADEHLERFRDAGADRLTVHYEACPDLHRSLQRIKELGMKAQITLNPDTPVDSLKDHVEAADLVLVMSVFPGYGAQKFIPESFERIKKLKELILEKNTQTLIEVDGGVNLENFEDLLKAGVDVLVVGNTIFSAEYPMETIRKLKGI